MNKTQARLTARLDLYGDRCDVHGVREARAAEKMVQAGEATRLVIAETGYWTGRRPKTGRYVHCPVGTLVR